MLSALILNQLSFPAVLMLYIYLSDRNIPIYIICIDIYNLLYIVNIWAHKQQVNQRLVTIISPFGKIFLVPFVQKFVLILF